MPTYSVPAAAQVSQVVNLAPNPSNELVATFLANSSMRTTYSKTGRDSGWAYAGSWGARYTGAVDADGLAESSHYLYWGTVIALGITGGQPHTFSSYFNVLQAPLTTLGLRLRIYWRDAANAAIGLQNDVVTPWKTGLLRATATLTAPALATSAHLLFYSYGVSGTTFDFYQDAVMVNLGGLMPYVDGDDRGAAWTGAAHNSTTMNVPSFHSPALTLEGNGPFVLDGPDAEVADEQWVRPGLLLRA